MRRMIAGGLAMLGIGKALESSPNDNIALNARELLFPRNPGESPNILRNADPVQLNGLPNASQFAYNIDSHWGTVSFTPTDETTDWRQCRDEVKRYTKEASKFRNHTYVVSHNSSFSPRQLQDIANTVNHIQKLVDPQKLRVSLEQASQTQVERLQTSRAQEMDKGCAIIRYTEDNPEI